MVEDLDSGELMQGIHPRPVLLYADVSAGWSRKVLPHVVTPDASGTFLEDLPYKERAEYDWRLCHDQRIRHPARAAVF